MAFRSIVRPACQQIARLRSAQLSRTFGGSVASMSGTARFDVAVVGGGIVGLATAREILGRYPHKRVVVLEKEAEVSLHQSGHNSGVIHAGIYYAPGSTMAKCCVRGADLMYTYCEAHGLPAERVGKLICAPTAADAHHLEKLLEIGNTNGVKGLQILDAAEVRKLEPNVIVHSALLSPNTGIADFGAVCRQISADITGDTGGSEVWVQFEVRDMNLQSNEAGGPAVEIVGAEPGQRGPLRRVLADNVVTCAGLHADSVAKLGGGATSPRVVTFRGTYYQMKPEFRDICKMNIYPTPSGGGIPVGVHFTPTVNQRRGEQMIVGPGAAVCFNREGYRFSDLSLMHMLRLAINPGLWQFARNNFDLAVTEMWRDINRTAFLDQARKLIPTVTDDMVEESFAGVMSQVFNDDGTPASDFIYERNMLGGTTLHVRSAPTPACTASFALAEEVVDQAAADFNWGQGREKALSDAPFWDGPASLAGAHNDQSTVTALH